ncbi:hypothetical protein B0H17DRAFT_1210233 [Mycena rosella]|uniref:Uncharacterized protein n=1 Tax=Mycena rosella TaxID=1033263 RepID=A0AAD7CWT7_MYCRO|nr:hypothetical protein B0H17DRAFT_1210233 [Mycena rosella]
MSRAFVRILNKPLKFKLISIEIGLGIAFGPLCKSEPKSTLATKPKALRPSNLRKDLQPRYSRSLKISALDQIRPTLRNCRLGLYSIFIPGSLYERELLFLTDGTLDLFIAIEGDVFDGWELQSALSPQLYHLYHGIIHSQSISSRDFPHPGRDSAGPNLGPRAPNGRNYGPSCTLPLISRGRNYASMNLELCAHIPSCSATPELLQYEFGAPRAHPQLLRKAEIMTVFADASAESMTLRSWPSRTPSTAPNTETMLVRFPVHQNTGTMTLQILDFAYISSIKAASVQLNTLIGFAWVATVKAAVRSARPWLMTRRQPAAARCGLVQDTRAVDYSSAAAPPPCKAAEHAAETGIVRGWSRA